MHIVRLGTADGEVHTGLIDDGSDPAVCLLPGRIADLLRLSLPELRCLVEETAQRAPRYARDEVRLLPPVDGHTEVWAAGVTYQRSRQARREESSAQSVYDRVYYAARPELFFKAPAWRVVTDGESVAVREDSTLTVPEPELAVVVNRLGDIVGYVVCDDVSSRSLEGDNPLYLPQAKVYAGSCALSTGIRPVWEIDDARDLTITMEIRHGEDVTFRGTVSTSAMRRDPADLARYLLRGQPFPDGAVLATGTGIVPDLGFTLHAGDVIHIRVAGVGELTNPVVRGQAGVDWLVDTLDQPLAREAAIRSVPR